MNVEDLKAKRQQLEVRFEEVRLEVSNGQSELTRLQGEWRAYGDMIYELEKDSASTIVVEEKKGKNSGK